MEITRKKGAFHDLHFKVDLTKYGKTGADIADIIFSVKEKETDPDDAYLYKSLSSSSISFTGTTILDVYVEWANTEYTNFVIGTRYKAGLFLKFVGDPEADENVSDIFALVIIQDFLRN